jgi:hypothetical protein
MLAALTAVAAIGAVLVAQTTPPAQAVSGLSRVKKLSASNSNTSKQVAAVCPAGQRVLGGGAEIVNGQGQVVIQRLQPLRTPTDDRFVAAAREDQTGYARAWRLRAYAICADPLPGLQIIASTTPASSDPQQSLVGLCPAGQREVGFGGRINNGAGQVRLTDLYDFFGPPSSLLIVGARENPDGYTAQWSLSSYTICADESATAGFVLAATLSPTDSQNKAVNVTCPPGTQVHTTGVLLHAEGPGQSTTASLVIDKVAVDASLRSATVRVVEDENATPSSWSVTGFALCAPPGP